MQSLVRERSFIPFFFNANRFEKSVTGNIKADCCKFVFVWIRICNAAYQAWSSCIRNVVSKEVVKIVSCSFAVFFCVKLEKKLHWSCFNNFSHLKHCHIKGKLQFILVIFCISWKLAIGSINNIYETLTQFLSMKLCKSDIIRW